MNTTLRDIADIRTGIFAKPGPDGQCVYLQSKHFDDSGVLNSELYADLEINSRTAKHLLKAGDVLFAAKGNKNFAALVGKSDPPSVASTTFFVLTVRDGCVLPEFLVWLLNSDAVQTSLKREAIGSSIVSISKKALSDLRVDVPSLADQTRILEIAELSRKENDLRSAIAELRQKLIRQKIADALN